MDDRSTTEEAQQEEPKDILSDDVQQESSDAMDLLDSPTPPAYTASELATASDKSVREPGRSSITLVNGIPTKTSQYPVESLHLIYRLTAENTPSKAIKEELAKQFGIEMQTNRLWEIQHARYAQPFIKQYRDKYMSNIKEIPVANKRIRIQCLEELRQKLELRMSVCSNKKASGKREFITYSRLMILLLDTVRNEMEQKPQLLQSLQIGDINAYTDKELLSRRYRLIEKLRLNSAGGDFGVGGGGEGTESEDPGEST